LLRTGSRWKNRQPIPVVVDSQTRRGLSNCSMDCNSPCKARCWHSSILRGQGRPNSTVRTLSSPSSSVTTTVTASLYTSPPTLTYTHPTSDGSLPAQSSIVSPTSIGPHAFPVDGNDPLEPSLQSLQARVVSVVPGRQSVSGVIVPTCQGFRESQSNSFVVSSAHP
jgi:hypothetical protein